MPQRFIYLFIFFGFFQLESSCSLFQEQNENSDHLFAKRVRTWPLKDRKQCINEWINVDFHAGNTRTGKLAVGGNANQISLYGSTDVGTYDLFEVKSILCEKEVVFPKQ